MPMPCSPEITPSEVARDLHDAHHGAVRLLQHLVVVGVDRNVRVHVAVAGMHVQRDPHAAAQHALVNLLDGLQHRRERAADEQPPQVRAHFRLPRRADGAVLQRDRTRACRARVRTRRSKSPRSGSKPSCASCGSASRSGVSRCSLQIRPARARLRQRSAAPALAIAEQLRATRSSPDRRSCRAAARRRSTPAARRAAAACS